MTLCSRACLGPASGTSGIRGRTPATCGMRRRAIPSVAVLCRTTAPGVTNSIRRAKVTTTARDKRLHGLEPRFPTLPTQFLLTVGTSGDIVPAMKISASIPDPLWNDAQVLGDGPSDIVQNAIHKALDGRATTRPARMAVELDEDQQVLFKVSASMAHARMVREYKRGYALGLFVAGSVTSDDAEMLGDRTGAVATLRDLVGYFNVPLDPGAYEAAENPDDLALLADYATFDGRVSIHLFLHVRSAIVDADTADKYGLRIDSRILEEPNDRLEALASLSGISWDLSRYGDGYARLRISRRYADGTIDAMLAVWDAAQSSLNDILSDLPTEDTDGSAS